MTDQPGILAIDVGSSRVKLGWFPRGGECTATDRPASLPIAAPRLPQPEETLSVSHADQSRLWTTIADWLQTHCPAGPPRYVASVHPPTLGDLQGMFANRLQLITHANLPLRVRLPEPERVGIDRLLNALAVNLVRDPARPAIVVDVGTACTVDLVQADGSFAGGAILPGVTLAAQGLHAGTAALPELTAEQFSSPPSALGKSTQQAIAAGVYWGLVGGLRELVQRLGSQVESAPQVFLTGGGAADLVDHLANDGLTPRHVPHLVLSGIAAVASQRARGAPS